MRLSLFSSSPCNLLQVSTAIQLSSVLTLLTLVITLSLTVWQGTDSRSQFVGIVADVVTVAMYASPLSVMHTVVTTKSVEFMPLPLSLNVLTNALAWTGET